MRTVLYRYPQGVAEWGFIYAVTREGFVDVDSLVVSCAKRARRLRVEREQRRIARRSERQFVNHPETKPVYRRAARLLCAAVSDYPRADAAAAQAIWSVEAPEYGAWQSPHHFTYERTGEPAEHYVMPVAPDFYAGGIVTPAELRQSLGLPGA